MRRSLGLSFASIVGFAAATAGAEEAAVGVTTTPGSPVSIFGNKGQIAISSEVGSTFERTSISGVDGSTTSFVVRPGVDYFVIKSLSVGAFVGVNYEGLPSGSTTTFAAGPRVGYDVAFSDHFSIWPRAGLSYSSTKVEIDGVEVGGVETPSTSDSNDAIGLNLFVPLLFHTHRFFAGVGPALDTDLSGDAKSTTFGVRVTLGGWVF